MISSAFFCIEIISVYFTLNVQTKHIKNNTFRFCFALSYKELQISVRNVTWDLRIKKPYIDNDGQCPEAPSVADSEWSSDQVKKTFTDGVVNDPNQQGKFTFLRFNQSVWIVHTSSI